MFPNQAGTQRMIIGVASQDVIRARARAVARGEHKPAPDGPKTWFTSMRSLAEAFLDENRALLKLIRGANPSL
jgi:predicted transcriptional regulator